MLKFVPAYLTVSAQQSGRANNIGLCVMIALKKSEAALDPSRQSTLPRAQVKTHLGLVGHALKPVQALTLSLNNDEDIAYMDPHA